MGGVKNYGRERVSERERRGSERLEREQPSKRVDYNDEDDGRSADGRGKERKDVRRREWGNQGIDSESSDGKGSDSADLEDRHRGNRYTGEMDRRERDRERKGSETQRQEQEQCKESLEEAEDGNRKRQDVRGRNGRQKSDSESSGEKGSDFSNSDGRHQNIRGVRKRDESGRDGEKRGTARQEHDQYRKGLKEVEDGNRKRRDARNKNGSQESDSESSGEENDDKKRSERSEQEQYGKSDREEAVQRGTRKGRDDRERDGRENDYESYGKERDKKRSERRERERPSKRLEEEDGDGTRTNRKYYKNNGRLEGDSDSSDEERQNKRSEKQRKEQSRKRLDKDEGDRKELVSEGRHGKRSDERSINARRGSDSESSGQESRRHGKERRRRERDRRKRQYDLDDSSDSDGHRRRHSTRKKNEKRDNRTVKQRSDAEDVDARLRRDRDEKASEVKHVARDGKGEETVRPQIQSTEANVNPAGELATLGRTGGVYIPPFKLARMMKEIEDKSSVEYQRLTWDALRKSINGLVNKVNATNIKNIIPELFSENLIRGRGLFCRSCMKSQMTSPGFTDVFAALVAVVNTKFPEVGDLLLRRIVLQLKRAYKRNDKPQLIAAVKFIAHLVNQQVAHELVALELLTILLEQPTDDSVEVAVDFVKECGSILQDLCPKGLHGIFERFRGILHEGEIDKRVQFLIEGLFAIRKAKFQGHPAVRPELDLVEPEEQLTHEISLEDEIDPEIGLDIFKQDPNFADNEKRYEELKKSILGDDSEDENGSDAESDDDDDDDEEDEDDDEEQMQIKDETETNLVNLRRTIYLTIMSSVDFEEAGHKLLKIKLEPGQEMELCIMLLECCSQERTYLRYYGLLGQRFCMLNKVHQENFEKCFVQQYSMIHRLETNKLRNVAKFFAHLLGTDALPWHVLAYIRLTEEDTTSSSRIFIKILFQELSEHLGIRLLNERLNDPAMGDSFESIFPKDNPRNTRFSINFFTSIGLGGITENLREYLKNMPRMIMQQKPDSEDESASGSGSDTDSSSSGSGSSSEDSDSDSSSDDSDTDDDRRRKRRKNDKDNGRDRKRRKGN